MPAVESGRYKFRNKDDVLFDIPDQFKLNPGTYKRRLGMTKRFGRDGGEPTGDRRVDARRYGFRFNNVSKQGIDDDKKYVAFLNSIAGFFEPEDAPFFLEDNKLSRRAKIETEDLSDKPMAPGLENLIGNNNLTFLFLDGHWEALAATIDSDNNMANGDIITVNNPGLINLFPIIRVQTFNPNQEFIIRNTTTGGAFGLGSNAFVPGSEFIINGRDGNIFLDDGISQIENSVALIEGSGFFLLKPGDNDIKYESIFSDVSIEIETRFRAAY